jgi:hypothetical protein
LEGPEWEEEGTIEGLGEQQVVEQEQVAEEKNGVETAQETGPAHEDSLLGTWLVPVLGLVPVLELVPVSEDHQHS